MVVVARRRRRRDEGGQRRPDAPFSLPANRCVNSPLGHVVLELALEDVLYVAKVACTWRARREACGVRRAAWGVGCAGKARVWGEGVRHACMHATAVCVAGVCGCTACARVCA